MDLLQCKNIDFAMLSETWLASDSHTIVSFIEYYGYTMYHSNQYGRGKGNAVLVSNKWSSICSKTNQFKYSTFDALALVLDDMCKSNIICFYRSPKFGASFSSFLNEFEEFISSLILNGTNFVLAGDFNVHWNDPTDQYTYRFQDLLDEMGICVTAPSCPTHNRGNTLDLIMANVDTSSRINKLQVDPDLFISDHYPLLFSLSLALKSEIKNSYKTITYRAVKNIDMEHFLIDLDLVYKNTIPNTDPNSPGDLSSIILRLNSNSKKCLDKHAPKQTKIIKQSDDKPPWFDNEYIQERAKRRKFEKRYKHTKQLHDWNIYRNQSIICRNMVKDKKMHYLDDTMSKIEGDQKALFKFVKNKICRKKVSNQLPSNYTDDLSLSNSFNNFFVNKVKGIRETFGSTTSNIIEIDQQYSLDELAQDDSGTLSVFELCTETEVRDIIAKTGIKVSPQDVFPPDLLEKSIETLIPYYTKLINLSMSSGSFDGLKDAIVRPLLKTGSDDHNNLSNYRPVANLTFLSKLVERVVLARLQNHMDKIDFKCDTQFGYKKHHGTETLLVKLVNDILIGLDSKTGVVLLLIDLSAAFDTVDHRKLINILATQLKIQGTALKWFKSYLTGRSQRVMIGETFSEQIILSFGIPQGSVLGPVLFNIYVSSLSEVFSEAGFSTLSYADDNSGYQAFSLSSATNPLNSSIPNLIDKISEWMKEYFLKLNEDKTKIIIFGSKFFKANLGIDTLQTFSGEDIDFADNVKYLGAYLDDRLTMKHHINKITSHCYGILKNIKSMRSFMSQQQCEILVNATVTSRLDYSNALFYNLGWSNCLQKISKVQKYASQIILQKNHRQGFSFRVRLETLHWLSVEKRIAFKILLLVFKCLHNMAPQLLCSLLSVNTMGRFSDSNVFKTTLFYPTTTFGRRAFIYFAPRLWNALPAYIRTIQQIASFKTELKTYLFTNYDSLMQQVNRYRT